MFSDLVHARTPTQVAVRVQKPSLYVHVHIHIMLTDICSVSANWPRDLMQLHMVSLILSYGDFGLSGSDNKQHVVEAPFHTFAAGLLLVSVACISASHPYAV